MSDAGGGARSGARDRSRSLLPAATAVVAFAAIVGLHLLLLNYSAPFGGQQSDDDYHYFGFAARLDAPDPFNLPAYRYEAPPDRVDHEIDRARLKISFSNSMPYPLWAYTLYALVAIPGLSFQTGVLLLFLFQALLLALGSHLLLRAMATSDSSPAWWVASSAAVVAYLGVIGIPSPLLCIPMNLAAAMCLCALGLLVHSRWRSAALMLAVAIGVHVAAIVLALFVLMVWLIDRFIGGTRETRIQAAVLGGSLAALVVGVWLIIYIGLLASSGTGTDLNLVLKFDVRRLAYLVRGMDYFLPVLAITGMITCSLAVRLRVATWRLPFACLATGGVAALIFILIETNPVGHPALHPAGRLLYLVPQLCVILVLALCWSLASLGRNPTSMRAAALLCGLGLALAVAWQDRGIIGSQFENRRAASLGPLHARLVEMASEPELARTAFVFYSHDYGTVLSAARLYYGRYIWAKVYSESQMERATSAVTRLVYLEGPRDPRIRIRGFCDETNEQVSLALDGRSADALTVSIVRARRCGEGG